MKIAKKKKYILFILFSCLLVFFGGIREIIWSNNAVSCKNYVGILMVFMIANILLMSTVLICENVKLSRVAFGFILLWGMIVGMAMPPGIVPDEPRHFFAAYELSNRILGTSQYDIIDEVTGGHTLMMRRGDIWSETEVSDWQVSISIEEYSAISGARFVFDDPVDLELVEETRYSIATSKLYKYIPSSMGICLARLLHLGRIPLLYIGRFFNLLFFATCVWWGIKQLDKGKYALFCIGTMPLVLCLASSYSYDAISNGLSVIFLSTFFSMYENSEKITVKNVLIMLLSYLFLLPYKEIYVVFGVLIFSFFIMQRKKMMTKWQMINEKFDKKYKILFLLLIGILVCLFLYREVPQIIHYCRVYLNGNRISHTGVEVNYYGLGDFIKTPRKIFYLIFDSIQYYLTSIIQGSFSFPWVGISSITYWGLFFCCIIVIMRSFADGYSLIIKKVSIFVFILMLACALLGCMLDMTTNDKTTIYGFQSRYVQPGITMLLIAFGTNEEFNGRLKKIFYAQNLFLIIAILYLLRKVIDI